MCCRAPGLLASTIRSAAITAGWRGRMDGCQRVSTVNQRPAHANSPAVEPTGHSPAVWSPEAADGLGLQISPGRVIRLSRVPVR